jgi:hypothetical protein
MALKKILKVKANFYHQIDITLEFKSLPKDDGMRMVAYEILSSVKERLGSRKVSSN